MNVYVNVVIADFEADADVLKIVVAIKQALAAKFQYNSVDVDLEHVE